MRIIGYTEVEGERLLTSGYKHLTVSIDGSLVARSK